MPDIDPAVEPLTPVETVTLQLPPYWSSDPELWFSQIEIKFAHRNIRSERRKYEHVVCHLPLDAAAQVRDLITRVPPTDPYSSLKSALIRRTAASRQQQIQRLLADETLGDRKPTQLLRSMTRLADFSPDNSSIFSEIFLTRLPSQVRAILATFPESASLDQLAEAADRIMDATGQQPQVASISHTPSVSPSLEIQELRKEIAELKSELRRQARQNHRGQSRQNHRSQSRHRSPSPSPDDLVCWYHTKYGVRAHKCTPPCSFTSALN